MRQNFIKKVINASAGTGKTYRLSLEYIALLLKFREQATSFREILVITFTRKATAEIRERIFLHLENITQKTKDGAEVVKNLENILKIEINDSDINYLKSTYHNMLTNKNQVQISTIDSFTNQIFASIIAPFHGITSYEIDERIEDKVLEEIYDFLLSSKLNLDITTRLFLRSGKRTIEDYEKFIKSLLQNRWLFHLIKEREIDKAIIDVSEKRFSDFKQQYLSMLQKFNNYLQTLAGFMELSDAFKREYFQLFLNSGATQTNFVNQIDKKLTPEFARQNAPYFIKGGPFWNGGKLLRKKEHADLKQELLDDFERCTELCAFFIFAADFLPEQQEILDIANLTFEKYDQIKFRDKIFTYNDISYYTFKHLYNPELSLIEGDSVSNDFYDYLTNRLRFILIDEFQDTSIVQYKILLPIIREIISGIGVKEYGGVIVVGDEKQSIYGWRGGERDLLLNMPQVLGEAEKETLDTSYRSNPQIINFCNSVFGDKNLAGALTTQNIEWPYDPIKTIKSGPSGAVQIEFRNYSNTKNDNNNISFKEDTIREFVEKTVLPHLQSMDTSPSKSVVLARRNDDLQKIATIFDEYAIPYVLNSSASVVNHRAIKPILFLLHFFVYKDYLDLLRFLRSDYVLLSSDLLKEVLLAYQQKSQNSLQTNKLLEPLQHIPAIKKVRHLYSTFQKIENVVSGLLNFVKSILEEFNILKTFPLESDAKNINLFLFILSEFQNSWSEQSKTLLGFLQYCNENQKKEAWTQQGLEDRSAINLMTIHKSKGLEFEHVFFFWDLNARSGFKGSSAELYVDYSFDFSQIADFAVAYNYDFVLPKSEKKHLYENKSAKEKIEDLNNFYVAMTRAKSNLFVYFAFKKSGGLSKLFKDIESSEDAAISLLMCKTLYNNFYQQENIRKDSENQTVIQIGEIKADPTELETRTGEVNFDVHRYLDFKRQEYLAPDEDRLAKSKFVNLKTTYIKNKDIVKGNVAHYYLSFIKFNSPDERLLAKQETLAFYGNLLLQEEIDLIITAVNRFIENNSEIFSGPQWPIVFTEHSLIHPTGKEVRLDRLMINQNTKEIKIIDYKTGSIWEEEQIDIYVETVKALPVCQKNRYNISGEFLKVNVD
jgi:ATP-dependent exoDNAse (exonuclease V) beta subunit